MRSMNDLAETSGQGRGSSWSQRLAEAEACGDTEIDIVIQDGEQTITGQISVVGLRAQLENPRYQAMMRRAAARAQEKLSDELPDQIELSVHTFCIMSKSPLATKCDRLV